MDGRDGFRLSRRSFLVGTMAAGVAGAAAACGLFGDDGPEIVTYGNHPSQFAEFWKPSAEPPWPVVVMIHGGAWRDREDRKIMHPNAQDLADRSYAVWNIEYRRLGEDGGGYPGTLTDVGRAIDALADQGEEIPVDPQRVIALGHSAGGHLALWAAARGNLPADAPGAGPRVRVRGVFALAPVPDLVRCADEHLVEGACVEFLGGGPSDVPDRYEIASPDARLPLGVRQVLLHGTEDEVVPLSLSQRYADDARAAGDPVELIELPFGNHFTPIDTENSGWGEVTTRVGDMFR